MNKSEEILENEENDDNNDDNQQLQNTQLNTNKDDQIKDLNKHETQFKEQNENKNTKNSVSVKSPLEIRKKDTADDNMSMNIELTNQNEFIHMDHFDEASKIGFGLIDFDNDRSRIKVLSNSNLNPNTDIHKRAYIKKEVNSEEEDDLNNDDEDEEKSSKNTFNNILIEHFQSPIHYLNYKINHYYQLSEFKTFKRFIKQKMPYYVNDQQLLDEFMDNKFTKSKREIKNDEDNNSFKYFSNKTPNPTNNSNNQSSNDFLAKKAQKTDSISAYYSFQNDLSNNKPKHLLASKSHINFNTNIDQTKNLEKDNLELKEMISEITKKIQNFQASNEKKSKELQKKNDKLILYKEKYDSLIQEKEETKTKIENIQIDISISKKDNSKKTERITELQNKISAIEQEHRDLLQKTKLESTIHKETKQNYELFKGNFIEIKNQYELLNIKCQSISDENFNYKRDLLLYEKEVKNKNEMIDKLRNNLLANAKYALNSDANGLSILETNNTTNVNINTNTNSNINNSAPTGTLRDNNHSKSPSPNRKNNYLKNAKNNKENHSTNKSLEKQADHTQDNNYRKEEKKNLTKNQQVKQIEIKISKLNAERDNINNELNKLPEHPKKKNVIEHKKEMENKIEQLGSDLVKLRIEMKKMKEEET